MTTVVDYGPELRMAIISYLKDDSYVNAIVGDRVFDEPIDDPQWPFIRYGLPIKTPFEASRLSGSSHRVTTHCFDKGPGIEGAEALAQAVTNALEDFSMDFLSVVDIQWVMTTIVADPIAKSAYHAIVQHQMTIAELEQES